jgi:16S rRNA (cytidine1402-2'-O)-methyltransferase
MPLFVVATPIGNPQDFSARALEALRTADLVIGEETKILRQILKAAGVQARAMDRLNEHSTEQDIAHFVNECRDKNVALVSDCGTPGFCDPGAELVQACAQADIPVTAVPGASSLMCLLSVCGIRLERFFFYGFLPAKTEERQRELKNLARSPHAVVVMETPYRAQKLKEDLSAHFADWHCVLGLNLTQENERVWRGPARALKTLDLPEKAEPIALLVPKNQSEKR